MIRDAKEVQAFYPSAALSQDNLALYQGWLEHEVRLPKCTDCGKWHQPSRSVCPFCWSFNLVPTQVSGRGKVHLSIILVQGRATQGVQYPYPVVVVDLEEQEGLRYTSTVVPRTEKGVPIGTQVELIWLDRGGSPFPAFRAVTDHGGPADVA